MQRRVGVVLGFALLLALANPVQAATPKAGAKCTNAGATAIAAGKMFTCIKSKTKLVWNKGVPIKVTPTPVATSTPTNSAPCKLPAVDGRGDVSIGGWPRISARSKTTGTVNVTVVLVDFPDAPAKMTPQEAFAKIEGAVDVFKEVSYGKLTYSFKPQLKWYRMSKDAKSYAPLNKSFLTHRQYVAEAIALSDSDVDFSKTDNIVILANPDSTEIGNSGPAFAAVGAKNGITVDGNNIMNGATSSHDLNFWKSIWLNHEITHALGLVDLYASTVGNSSNRYDGHRYVGEFSYMGLSSYLSNSPSLLAFERWNLGWIDDSQIICSNAVAQAHTISAVEVTGGLKAVIIPLNRTKVLVIESRRAVGLDTKMVKGGALVYLVDSSIQSGKGPIQVYPIDLKSDPRYLQAPRAVGEKVTVAGYTITVVKSDEMTDSIEITKE